MTLALKIGAIVSAGVFAGWLVNMLAAVLGEKLSALKPRAETGKSEDTAADKSREDAVKKALRTLSEEPSSKESRNIKIIVSLLPFLLIYIVSGNLLFGLLAGVGAFYAIGAYFSKKIEDKLDLFNDQLIEALGVIANSVRAGQSFMQALENMVKDSKPPLSTEFEIVLSKIRLGTSVSQALIEMLDRVKSNDLRISVISINLARESGGNMGEILSGIAETMRERKKIKGKIAALTAQGKASGIVMGFVPFILLGVLYFIQPNIMSLLFSTVLGNIMLCMVVIMVTVGMIVINKIVNIDV